MAVSVSKAELWVDAKAAAAAVGVTVRQFNNRWRPEMPKSAVKGGGKGRPVKFQLSAIIAADRKLQKSEWEESLPSDEDPLMNGGDSPALERYRAARASIEERRLAQMDRTLVDLELLTEAMRPAIRGMRSAGDQLARKFGNDAAEIHNEAVDRFEQALHTAAEEEGGDEDDREAR